MTFLIFDTETTGLILHPAAKDELQPQIIEWGGALVDEKGTWLEELDVLINPGKPLPENIIRITGITDDDLRDQPAFSAYSKKLRALFAKADCLIAHNLPFDHRMMELELARIKALDWPWPARNICTVREHEHIFGHRPKLTELYEHFTGRKLEQSHRALDDVKALAEVCVIAGVLK